MHNQTTSNMQDRYRAVMIGTGIGDTLGMAVEGWKKAQIEKYVGRVIEPIDPVKVLDAAGNLVRKDEFGTLKYYTSDLKKGEYTDDTALLIALAEALLEKGYDLEHVAKKHIEKYLSMKAADGHIKGGFGRTTTLAFDNLINGVPAMRSGVIGGPGNAPAMKMASLGLYMHALPNPYTQGFQFAYDVGKITHLDPRSLTSGVVQAYAVASLLDNPHRLPFLLNLCVIGKHWEKSVTSEFACSDKGSLTERLEWVLRNSDSSVEEAFKKLGNNSDVYKSYPFTIFMFQKYWDNPLEGLIETVNWGGDCDTTGAIYGALSGAKHGCYFPKEWKDVLQDVTYLEELGDKLYALRGKHD